MRSALYEGTLLHARTAPARNVFRYRVYFYGLDLDELPELDQVEAVEVDGVAEHVAGRRGAGVQERPLVERGAQGGHQGAPRPAAAFSPERRPSSWKPNPW